MILYKYLSGEKVKNSKSVVIIVLFELPQHRKKNQPAHALQKLKNLRTQNRKKCINRNFSCNLSKKLKRIVFQQTKATKKSEFSV